MDQQKLRNLVFEKTGVKIDVDDPVFALVALNEAVLAEAVERHVALLDDATGRLAQAAGLPAPGAPSAPKAAPEPVLRTAAIALGSALAGGLVLLAGQAMLAKPAPAPVLQAKELTLEQATAVKNAEKLARAVEKLDRKTRNAIDAEMQKP